MHLVWKRPDGFHEANPSDYQVVDLGNNFKLWLHKKDRDQYPFRIAGGWEEKEGTIRLNNLVNLLNSDDDKWVEHLKHSYDHSMKDDKLKFIEDLLAWIKDLESCPKGWASSSENQVPQKKSMVGGAPSRFVSVKLHEAVSRSLSALTAIW